MIWKTFFSTFLLLLTIGGLNAFHQKLVLSSTDDETVGDYVNYVFRSNVPNMTETNIGTYSTVCATGNWILFDEPNFKGLSNSYISFGSELKCQPSYGPYNSFRHLGPLDLSLDYVTFYTDGFYGGDEIYFDGDAFAGISSTLRSLVISGNSDWRFYTGSMFNGTSVCKRGPLEGDFLATWSQFFDNVGSIRKGCV